MMFNKFLMAVTVRTPPFKHARIHQFLEPAILDPPNLFFAYYFQTTVACYKADPCFNLKQTRDLSVVLRNVSILLYNVPLPFNFSICLRQIIDACVLWKIFTEMLIDR